MVIYTIFSWQKTIYQVWVGYLDAGKLPMAPEKGGKCDLPTLQLSGMVFCQLHRGIFHEVRLSKLD